MVVAAAMAVVSVSLVPSRFVHPIGAEPASRKTTAVMSRASNQGLFISTPSRKMKAGACYADKVIIGKRTPGSIDKNRRWQGLSKPLDATHSRTYGMATAYR